MAARSSMGMAGPDIVLFVVGLVLFSGAAAAIVALDEDADLTDPTSGLGVFDVRFTPQTNEVGSESVASLRSATATFEVETQHSLRALVEVACSGGLPVGVGPVIFQLQVTVEGPGGITADGSGQCGQELVIEIPLGTAPPDMSVAGTTETEARENLPAPESDPANGAWTVTVSGSRGGTPATPVGDPSGTITFSIESATPQFTPVQR